MSHIPRIPSIAEQIGNGKQLVQALDGFLLGLRHSIEKAGHKGQSYIDLPGGRSLKLAGLRVADGDSPGFIAISGFDEASNETHVFIHYSQVIVRVVIDKGEPAKTEE